MSEPVTPPVTPPAAGTEDTTVALLSYLTPVGFIVAIVMHGNKKTKLGAYHLRQNLGLYIVGLVIWIPCMIISLIPVVQLIMVILGPAICLGFFVLWLMGILAAVNGQQKPAPVLGENFQKWFAGAFV